VTDWWTLTDGIPPVLWWQKAVRVATYVCLWLVFFIPAEMQYRRGAVVPRWLKYLIWVSGLMLSVALTETFR
jgi:hypothetical protein